MKGEQAILLAAGMIAPGIWLASKPNCDRGCQTVADHLIVQGLDDFLGGLIGA